MFSLLAIAPTVGFWGLYGFVIFSLGVTSLMLLYGSKKGWARFRKPKWVQERIKKLDEQYGEKAKIFNKEKRKFLFFGKKRDRKPFSKLGAFINRMKLKWHIAYCKKHGIEYTTKFYKPKSFYTRNGKGFSRKNSEQEIVNTAYQKSSIKKSKKQKKQKKQEKQEEQEVINTAYQKPSSNKNEFAYKNLTDTIEIDTKRHRVNKLFNQIVNDPNYDELEKNEFDFNLHYGKNSEYLPERIKSKNLKAYETLTKQLIKDVFEDSRAEYPITIKRNTGADFADAFTDVVCRTPEDLQQFYYDFSSEVKNYNKNNKTTDESKTEPQPEPNF